MTRVAAQPPTRPHGARSSDLLERARASRAAARSWDWDECLGAKRALLPMHDALGIDEVLAVCYWGRSGSRLLSSFLDGHDHVLMLPMEQSQRIYEFAAVHPGLTLLERLTAYPIYVEDYTPVFGGEFTVDPTAYHAAVQALVEHLGAQPVDVLNSPRAFFQCLHVAYSIAIGQRPAVRRPVIVYAQHRLNYHTTRLVRDFPKARFVHTVRDPVSSFDSTFIFYLNNAIDKQQPERADLPEAALRTLVEMATTDVPNRDMEQRTRAVRFEDMHRHTEATMRALADWIGIPFSPSLLASTFNGVPWTVTSKGRTWSGAVPEQARRRAPNLGWPDLALVHALFHEDFVAWDYRHPRLFGRPVLRRAIAWVLGLVPTRIEWLNARPALRTKVIPALRQGQTGAAWKVLKTLWIGHREWVARLRAEIAARSRSPRAVLPLLGVEHVSGGRP